MLPTTIIERPDLKVLQIKTACLAHFAYIIVCGEEVAVLDPLRDSKDYLDIVAAQKGKLRYIIESHYHADFVSGFLDLAQKTGAEVVFGPLSDPAFKARVMKDQECISLGNYKIRCLHTPGHTMESSCYVLEKDGEALCVFTGDTLFLGDVGRPDLAQKGEITEKHLAMFLFHSLKKLKSLKPEVLVLPSHGAGSACGKAISQGNVCDIGTQLKNNVPFREADEAAFIELTTSNLPTPPSYFADNIPSVDRIKAGAKEFTPEQVEILVQNEQKLVILDCRPAAEFAKGHIPGSVHVPFDGKLAIWATYVVANDEKILLVTSPEHQDEVVTRLARTGLDNVVGHLKGSFASWAQAGKPIAKVDTLTYSSGNDFESKTADGVVLDIRDPGEIENGVYDKAIFKNFAQLRQALKLKDNQKVYIHCQGGVRSLIGYSLMKKLGYNVTNIDGGFKKMAELGVKTVKKTTKQACTLI